MPRKHNNPHLRLHTEEASDNRRPNVAASQDEVAECLAKFARATGWGIRSTMQKQRAYVAPDADLATHLKNPNEDLLKTKARNDMPRWEVVNTTPVDGLLDAKEDELLPSVSQRDASDLLKSIEKLVARLERAEAAIRQQQAVLATDVSITRTSDDKVDIADRLESILASSCRSIGAAAAAIYLLDDTTSELKMRACYNLPIDRLIAPARTLRGSLADLEALLGNAVLIEDTAFSTNWPSPENFASALVVPIGTVSMPHGTIWFWSEQTRNYSSAEVEVANLASGRVMNELEHCILGVEVQESRNLADQMDQASIAQAARWPDNSPLHRHMEVSGWSLREGALGGAFHDWEMTSNEQITALFGDALCSGPQGAIIASSIQAIVRSSWTGLRRPCEILQSVGDYLFTGGAEDWAANATLIQMDPDTGRGSLATAGNNQIFIISHRGFRPLGSSSKPLATSPMLQCQLSKFVLQPGEVLIGMSSNLVAQLNLPAAIKPAANQRANSTSNDAYNRLRRERRSLSKTLDQNELLREVREMLDENALEIARHIASRLPTFVKSRRIWHRSVAAGDSKCEETLLIKSDLALQKFCDKLRFILSAKMSDAIGWNIHLGEVRCDAVPHLLPFLAFCKVQLGHQFANALECNRLSIVVIVLDALLLVTRIIIHAHGRDLPLD